MTTQMKVPDYFGGCPQCGRNDGYVNAGKTHVFICREHPPGTANDLSPYFMRISKNPDLRFEGDL
jgi:hypothetical protein